jgi:hypothetical protein
MSELACLDLENGLRRYINIDDSKVTKTGEILVLSMLVTGDSLKKRKNSKLVSHSTLKDPNTPKRGVKKEPITPKSK